MSTVSLCMIVRDEEEVLGRCLLTVCGGEIVWQEKGGAG